MSETTKEVLTPTEPSTEEWARIAKARENAPWQEVRIIIKNGYIGASRTLPPEDGEWWRRGNDLADGPLTDETVDRIAADLKALIRGYRNNFDRFDGEPIPVNLPPISGLN